MDYLVTRNLSKLALVAALVSVPMMLGNDGCGGIGVDQDALCEDGGTVYCPGAGACTLEYAPVCGVNGRTYGNRCHARRAGVDVAHEGECAQTTCGGLLGLTCPAHLYCAYAPEAQCGAGDQTGVCAPRPEACDQQYDPVCGCDGQTYGNACSAASEGVSVVHAGACGDGGGSGKVCGGFLGEPCPGGEFCDYAIEAQCGNGDQQGVCRVPPYGCPDVWDPVCGCDGNTYGNACDAAQASVSVLHEGECAPQRR